MKNIRFLLILLAIAAFSPACKDECKDVTCLNGGVCVEGTCDCPIGYVGDRCDEKISFNVTGVRDTVVYVNDTTRVPISVVWNEGPKENVTLEVNNLPAGVTAYIEPNTGTPNFNATLFLVGGTSAQTGVYNNVTVDASVGSGLAISRNFNISVENNCRPFLAGSYDIVENCGTGTWSYTSTIYEDPTVSNRLRIDKFADVFGMNVYLVVDCDGQTLTLPSQNVASATVSGNGTFNLNDESIILNYEIKYSGTTETCSATYTKK